MDSHGTNHAVPFLCVLYPALVFGMSRARANVSFPLKALCMPGSYHETTLELQDKWYSVCPRCQFPESALS
jgi:hypothetical protein